jgi:hypothetical protein
MLTPPESSGSPMMGSREGLGFTIAGGGDASAFAAISARQLHAERQHQNLAEGVWSRFAASERNGAREASSPWTPTMSHPADSRAAAEKQIALANKALVERQITVDVAKLVASFRSGDAASEVVPQPSNNIPYRGLDYDCLRTLRSYIYNEDSGVRVDEEALLNRLEKQWREGVRGDYTKMIQDVPVFIARERAFLTWIELKRHVAAFMRAEERMYIFRLLYTPLSDTHQDPGWSSEEATPTAIERRHQQFRTLMAATETILANFEDVGQGISLEPGLGVNRDELLRQAVVVLAGEKYAVEMQWKAVEFTDTIAWLADALDAFRKEEEEEGSKTLWYVG